MAATTTSSAAADEATTTPPTDEQILTQLATLQSLHSKIFQLRSLLPGRLIDPVRAAVKASHSGYEPPTALAAHLRSVAVDGDKDIKAFQERWRSKAMKEVWTASSDSAFPQGSDLWSVDYEDVAAVDAMDMEYVAASNEDVEKALEVFEASNPKVKLEREYDGEGWITIDVTVAGQNFTITRPGGEVYSVWDWVVTAKAGSLVTERLQDMLRSFEERPSKGNLAFLLVSAAFLSCLKTILESVYADDTQDMIASYKDLKTRPCEKCKTIFDDDIQLPAMRVSNPTPGDDSKHLLAYHRHCL